MPSTPPAPARMVCVAAICGRRARMEVVAVVSRVLPAQNAQRSWARGQEFRLRSQPPRAPKPARPSSSLSPLTSSPPSNSYLYLLAVEHSCNTQPTLLRLRGSDRRLSCPLVLPSPGTALAPCSELAHSLCQILINRGGRVLRPRIVQGSGIWPSILDSTTACRYYCPAAGMFEIGFVAGEEPESQTRAQNSME